MAKKNNGSHYHSIIGFALHKLVTVGQKKYAKEGSRRSAGFFRADIRIALSTSILVFLLVLATNVSARDSIQYQQATRYSHLIWPNTDEKIVTISIAPIINLSGIPLLSSITETNDANSNYFNHGKLPANLDLLLDNSLLVSRRFQLKKKANYKLTYTIDEVQLPLSYAADDIWWQKLHDQVDRWGMQPKAARVSISVEFIPISANAKVWMPQSKNFSVSVTLSNCDLNKNWQPLTASLNQQPGLRHFSQSLVGQAFIAANNYLTLKLIDTLKNRPHWAQVIAKQDHMLLLQSQATAFQMDDKLQLFYQQNTRPNADNSIVDGQYYNPKLNIADLPMGELHIDRLMGNRALAWPVNLRPDQIKIGDQVLINKSGPSAETPTVEWRYQPAQHCAVVENSIAVNE